LWRKIAYALLTWKYTFGNTTSRTWWVPSNSISALAFAKMGKSAPSILLNAGTVKVYKIPVIIASSLTIYPVKVWDARS